MKNKQVLINRKKLLHCWIKIDQPNLIWRQPKTGDTKRIRLKKQIHKYTKKMPQCVMEIKSVYRHQVKYVGNVVKVSLNKEELESNMETEGERI